MYVREQMSSEFAEYKLLIMKEQETMAQAIKDLTGIVNAHIQEYNFFKGKLYGIAIAIPFLISIATTYIMDKLK